MRLQKRKQKFSDRRTELWSWNRLRAWALVKVDRQTVRCGVSVSVSVTDGHGCDASRCLILGAGWQSPLVSFNLSRVALEDIAKESKLSFTPVAGI